MANFRSDIAQEIRSRISADYVARHYGFEPNRSGFIKCPFHQGDHTGSLKLYPGTGGFHCFGCGAHGSVIDFVMKLFDLSFPQAVVRLSSDFNLGLTAHRPTKQEASKILEERRKKEAEKEIAEQEYRRMAEEHRYWWEVLKYFDFPHPLWERAVKRLPYLEYWLDENLGVGR